MILEEISSVAANEILGSPAGHYLGGLKYTPRFCIATPQRDAVAVYTWPVAQHFKVKLSEPLELIRLWQAPGVERQVSQFLAASIRWVRRLAPASDCIFSYADPSQRNSETGEAHRGTIYRAANFAYFGASRVTDYWAKDGVTYSSPKMYRMFKTKSRTKLIDHGFTLIEKLPKHLYVFGLQRTPSEVREIIGGRYA